MRRFARTSAGVSIVVALLAAIRPAGAQQPAGPTASLSVNRPSVVAGDTLVVTLTTSPGSPGQRADLYVAVGLPGGGLAFITGTQGIQATPTTFAQGVVPSAGTTEVLRVAIPAGVNAGAYPFYAVYVRTETDPFIQANWVSNLASAAVTLVSSGGVGGNWTVTGTLNRLGCTSGTDGPDSATGTFVVTQSASTFNGSGPIRFGTSPITLQLTFSGSLSGNQLTATATIVTPQTYRGTASFTGSVSGDQISVQFSGRLTQGETCVYTGTLSGTIRR